MQQDAAKFTINSPHFTQIAKYFQLNFSIINSFYKHFLQLFKYFLNQSLDTF